MSSCRAGRRHRRGAELVKRALSHLLQAKLARGWHAWQARGLQWERRKSDAASTFHRIGRVVKSIEKRRLLRSFRSGPSQAC